MRMDGFLTEVSNFNGHEEQMEAHPPVTGKVAGSTPVMSALD